MNPRELIESLNASQREAVMTTKGPLLVLAGAGTGKTRVITTRMALLISQGVSPERILSVTFTNKASKEMAERLRSIFGKRMKSKPRISTFHSLCVRILREEIEVLGYRKNFTILDRGDQESIARDVLRKIRIQEAALKPGDLLGIISRWKSAAIQPEQAVELAEDDREFLASMAYKKYREQLRARNSLDFDDLLLMTDQLFAHHPDALQRQQECYDFIQIDEYQDTNQLQFRVVQALVEPHANLCVVGDDDQSIYGWRGAEVKHILSFQQHFPAAKVVRLEDNYRCTDEILTVANRLVSFNRERHRKVLRSTKKGIEPVRYEKFQDEVIEAERVIMEINYLINHRDKQPHDFAILFRTNEQPRAFESELRRRQLPYVILGSQSFFDRKEIRDLIAYLRIIAYPKDETSLLRIINVPARNIGTGTIDKIMTCAISEGIPFFEAVESVAQKGLLGAKPKAAVDHFRHQLESWRRQFASGSESLANHLRKLIDSLNYMQEIEKLYKQSAQQQIRRESIEQLISSLEDYSRRARQPSLQEFLDEIALNDRDEFASGDKKELEQNAIKLLTIHSAKGLEFLRVYLVGMEEGLLPHKRSVLGTEKEIEEERRLAYVAVTRAQESLTMTFAETRKKWGKAQKTIPSRFLYEMRGDREEQKKESADPADSSRANGT